MFVSVPRGLAPQPFVSGEQEHLSLLCLWGLRWNDRPGERLFLQLQKVLPSLVHHQLPLGCKDFGEYYTLKIKH